jgi:hypothetical protein
MKLLFWMSPTEDKSDYTKDSFYEKLEHHMKILVGDS